jgi:hypothetical protein
MKLIYILRIERLGRSTKASQNIPVKAKYKEKHEVNEGFDNAYAIGKICN